MKKILIIHSRKNVNEIQSLVSNFGTKEWIPFISDYERVRKIENILLKVTKKRRISSFVQETARRLRRPFLRIIAEMGKKYNSLSWWTNSISEKNTMANKLFQKCCYVFMARELLKENKNLCILCDSNAVIDNIGILSKKEGYIVKKKKSHCIYSPQETVLWMTLAWVYEFLKGICFWFLNKVSRAYLHASSKAVSISTINPDIILHTWVDKKSLGKDGIFRDRYFTILPEFYESKSLRTATLVSAYPSRLRHFWCMILFLRRNKGNFIIPEDYYTLSDYMFPLKLWLKKFTFKFQLVLLEGIDVSTLFKANNRVERVPFVSMYYILFKRLAAKGIAPKIIVDAFENMAPNKMIQLGARKFMPNVKIYGFYHTTPSPNVLCFFTDKEENKIAPLPDKIICNGRKFRDILINEHFPKEKITVGAALRYAYLHDLKRTHYEVNVSKGFRILLTLPLVKEAAIELFDKTLEAVHEMRNYCLLVKPHPMGMFIIDEIKNSFPEKTKVLCGSMEEALKECDIVISAATGAVLDCLMADKKVIRICRETQIDFDPISWFDEFGKPVSNINELKENIENLKKAKKEGSHKQPNYSSMLSELFAPPTAENMSVFLP